MVVESDDSDEEGKKAVRYRGTRPRDQDFLENYSKKPTVVKRKSGLQYRPMRTVDKSAAKPGPSTPCRVHYHGILTDGTVFDSTYRKGPTIMTPEQGKVEGFREALQLMREGEKWEVILPASLGYGEVGAGPIPQGAALLFEMELLEVDPKEELVQVDGWDPKVLGIGVFVLLGMLLFAFQHFTRAPATPRGPLVSLADVTSVVNPRVFFDIEISGEPVGRIEFELFVQVAPITAENFRALATGEKGMGRSGNRLHYKGSKIHRIIPGFMCQGGDFTSGDGRGGESIYGTMFKDEWEHGVVHHTEPGLLSMANRGRDTNGSQFFITTAAVSWLDGKHVVFGRVASGMDVVMAIEKYGSRSGQPSEAVVIVESGQLGRDAVPLQVVERVDHMVDQVEL